MKTARFYILDVFSKGRYTGNQLAVVLAWEGMTTEQMQSIAREMNFSETTFIDPSGVREGRVGVRIFTPGREVPFAGHPTLGTAYIAITELMAGKADEVTLELKAGPVHVRMQDAGRLVMKQLQPSFGKTLSPDALATVLGLSANDIDLRSPIEEVSTGLPFIIVPIRNIEHVKAISMDTAAYYNLIANLEAKAIYIFCLQTLDPANHIHARMFAPALGIAEDPATGSAAGCLAAYLLKHNVLGSGPVRATVEQGGEINRPSLLYIGAEHRDGSIEIHVAGNVTMVARGELL